MTNSTTRMSLEELEALIKKTVKLCEDTIEDRNYWRNRANRLQNHIEVQYAVDQMRTERIH